LVNLAIIPNAAEDPTTSTYVSKDGNSSNSPSPPPAIRRTEQSAPIQPSSSSRERDGPAQGRERRDSRDRDNRRSPSPKSKSLRNEPVMVVKQPSQRGSDATTVAAAAPPSRTLTAISSSHTMATVEDDDEDEFGVNSGSVSSGVLKAKQNSLYPNRPTTNSISTAANTSSSRYDYTAAAANASKKKIEGMPLKYASFGLTTSTSRAMEFEVRVKARVC
jgi:hypothetical protein